MCVWMWEGEGVIVCAQDGGAGLRGVPLDKQFAILEK